MISEAYQSSWIPEEDEDLHPIYQQRHQLGLQPMTEQDKQSHQLSPCIFQLGQHDQQQPRFQLGPPEIQIEPDPIDMQPHISPNNHLFDQLRLRRGSQLSQSSQQRNLQRSQVMHGQDNQEYRKQDPLDRFINQQRLHPLDIQQHRRRLSAQEDIQINNQQLRRLSLNQDNIDFGHHRLQLGPADIQVEYDNRGLKIENSDDHERNIEDKTYEDVLELKLEDHNHHRLKMSSFDINLNHPLEKVLLTAYLFFIADLLNIYCV